MLAGAKIISAEAGTTQGQSGKSERDGGWQWVLNGIG